MRMFIVVTALLLSFASAFAGNGTWNTLVYSGTSGCPTNSSDYYNRFNSTAADQFNLAIRLYDTTLLIDTSANFGQGTGLTISDYNKTMRNNDFPGYPENINYYSAFQLDCGKFGSFINTWTWTQQSVPGGGPNVVYGVQNSSPLSIYDATYNEAWFQTDGASLAWLMSWGGIGQLSLVAFFLHENQAFQILVNLYDSRTGYTYTEHASWDSGTLMAFATAPMTTNTYLTPGPSAYGFSGFQTGPSTWTGLAFRAQVSRQNFVNILNAINSLCAGYRAYQNCLHDFPVPDPNNANDPLWTTYTLNSMNVLHEVFYAGFGNISMGVNSSGVGAYIYSRPGVN